jgi:hypothetical protein
MKPTDSDQQKIRGTSEAASFARPGPPFFGSHPTAMLRKANGNRNDPINPPPNFPSPQPVASAPDFAMQFKPCLESIPVPAGTDLRADLIEAVKAAVGQNADVRYSCIKGSGRIGIWLRPAGNSSVNLFREKSMTLINVLSGDEIFAIWVNSSYIRVTALEDFDAGPLQLDHDGNAQPDGPVHLTGIDITFDDSGKIVTSVTGFDETPFPDVNFTLSITDAFSVSGYQLIVDSRTNLDTDRSWMEVIAGAFFVLGTFVSPWFFIGAIGFEAESIYISTVGPGDRGGGAGSIAAKNIPKEIYIKGGQKIVCQYNNVTINQLGIVAGGTALVVARMPSCSIFGSDQIAVPPGARTVSSLYQANTNEMRGHLNIHWSGNVTRQGQVSTLITFDLTGLAPGKHIERYVQLQVTDADGLTAEAKKFVSIHMASIGDNIPQICHHKPWLPECQA